MAALQYVDTPGYAALVLMRTFADLALPSAGMSRAREWLGGTAARPVDGGRQWVFPSGATLTFGYLSNTGDEHRYRTAEFQFLAFDELTRFPEQQYTYLFSRLRRLAGSDVPLRVRAATNPGGPGHDWVKQRFIPEAFLKAPSAEQFGRCWWQGGRLFVPARLEDNASLDQAEYESSLAELDPVTRAQLRHGDWKAHAGGRFKAEWFRSFQDLGDAYRLAPLGDVVPYHDVWRFVAVDPAGGTSDFSDYTAVGVWAVTPARDLLLLDVIRDRIPVEEIVPAVAAVCAKYRPAHVVMEEVFLQSALVRAARRHQAIPTVYAIEPGGKSKLVRATPAIIRAEAGQVYLPREAPWLDGYLGELCQFTGDPEQDGHDDQVDMTAYAILALDQFGLLVADEPVVTGRKRGELP